MTHEQLIEAGDASIGRWSATATHTGNVPRLEATGKESESGAPIETHRPVLKAKSLVTDKQSTIMRSQYGTVVEVFEWKSKLTAGAACRYSPKGAPRLRPSGIASS